MAISAGPVVIRSSVTLFENLPAKRFLDERLRFIGIGGGGRLVEIETVTGLKRGRI
jgi:hypothetical protein